MTLLRVRTYVALSLDVNIRKQARRKVLLPSVGPGGPAFYFALVLYDSLSEITDLVQALRKKEAVSNSNLNPILDVHTSPV